MVLVNKIEKTMCTKILHSFCYQQINEKATVSVVGINAYTGKKDIKFTINKETMDWADALANILGNLF